MAVDGQVVTLTGHVRSFSDKVTIREIVEGIRGVRAIADEIEVRPIGANITADDEIAKRIVNTLKWNSSVPDEKIKTTVTKGWVTLEGQVEWHYQSTAAEQAVRRLVGVTGVNNRLRITPAVKPADVSQRIQKALQRDAELDASAIKVNVDGGKVTLEGRVRYLGERRSAERAAWSAPGVTEVVDHLTVA